MFVCVKGEGEISKCNTPTDTYIDRYIDIKLYEICNARDDFDLYITSDIESVKDDKTKNYLIREDNNYLLCMQCYKTSKNKDPIFIKVTPELKILLDNYIKLHIYI